MRRSTERILTMHVGSLPRPADLREMWSNQTSGLAEEALRARLRSAVSEVVLAQRTAGVDIPNDGEFGKPMRAASDRGAWGNYIFNRVSGFVPTPLEAVALDVAAPGASMRIVGGALGATGVRRVLRRHGSGSAEHCCQPPDVRRSDRLYRA